MHLSISHSTLATATSSYNTDSSMFGYGLGVAVRKIGNWLLGRKETPHSLSSFTPVWQQLFSQKEVTLIHITDSVQDDFVATVLEMAASLNPQSLPEAKTLKIAAFIPTIGFVVQSQAALNVVRIASLASYLNVGFYPGSTDISNPMLPPNYYGKNGLEDVEGWPKVNISSIISPTPGYLQLAELIRDATGEKPVTVMVTAPLTELAKALMYLQKDDPGGSFAANIAAIIIRGGCIYPDAENQYGCNAPYTVPDRNKNSESNFYADVAALQNVTTLCNQYQIKRVLLPLGLTQSVLWTNEQIKQLEAINNNISQQLVNVTRHIPYPDARRFPADNYPMHDIFAAAALIRPDLFRAMNVAISSIGPVGQITINDTATDEERLVYLLSLPEDVQETFFSSILPLIEKFTCHLDPDLTSCDPNYQLKRILMIAVPVGTGVLGIITLFTACIIRERKRRNQADGENKRLLAQNKTLQVTTDGMESLIKGMQKELGVASAQEGEEEIE